MAFPDYATVAQGDDVTRANESPIDGGKWEFFTGAGLAGPLNLTSNQAVASVNSYCGSFLMFGGPWIDTEFFCTVATIGDIYYLKTRLQAYPYKGLTENNIEDPAQSCYSVSINETNLGDWNLYRKINGTDTSIATVVTGFTPANGDGIGMASFGSTIEGWHRVAGVWTRRIVATDTTLNGGYNGLVVSGNTSKFTAFAQGGRREGGVPSNAMNGRNN